MLQGFDRFAPKNERNDKFIALVRKKAEKMVGTPIYDLPFSEFLKFYETGSRVEYEELYMEHRKRLWHFAAMALYEDDPVWVRELSDTISAICGEPVWTFPAHVSEDASFKEMRDRIDLFAAETSEALAETVYLLGDRLPKHIVDMVKFNIEERIVEPFINVDQGYPKNNWQAVCNGCVAITLMELSFTEAFEKTKDRIVEGLNIFLDSYPDDGICLEGPLYWAYGFGYFVYAAAMLREYTAGEIDLLSSEKVENIASFYEYAFVSGEYTVPFADAGHILYLNPGLVSFLHREYGTPMISEQSAMKYGFDLRWHLADMTRNLFWSLDFVEKQTVTYEEFFPDAEWYYNRKDKYTLVAKGGYNDEPHNHNDIGSFVVFSDGKYIVDDLGWPEYDKEYFNPEQRYKNYICATSLGHSVPIVNGEAQLYGKDKSCRVIESKNGTFAIDISGAYGLSEGSVLRTLRCYEDSIKLTDAVSGGNTLVSRVALRIKPRICDGRVFVGGSVIEADISCKISLSEQVFETRYSVAVSDTERFVTAYFVDFIPTEAASKIQLTIKV
ncbi:MAG: heparinase II/III family protein [Clostridia bacterium]|nr:heparinase II/III family protein [Clostridia bacterium]